MGTKSRQQDFRHKKETTEMKRLSILIGCMCVAFFVNAQSLYYIHNGVHSDLLSMERLKKFVIYKDHIKLLASDDSEIASLEITDKMSFVIKDNDTEPSAIKDSRTARGDGYDIDFEAGCIHLYNVSKGTKAFLYNLNGRLVKEFRVTENQINTLPISDIPQGYYILSLGPKSLKFKK